MLASPTIQDLATFTGRQTTDFNSYVTEALAQATLLFYLATDLNDYPENTSLATLAKNGILDMADKIYLGQPYREVSASPYQSETIGSYSYSKAATAIKRGDATGILWFDLAVNKLKAGSNTIGASGSIQGMEWDNIEYTAEGNAKLVGPKDQKGPYSGTWELDIYRYYPNV